jgi:hypothetical protein
LVLGLQLGTIAGDHVIIEKSNAVSDGSGGLVSDGTWTTYLDVTITNPDAGDQSGTAAALAVGPYVLRARSKRGTTYSPYGTEQHINIAALVAPTSVTGTFRSAPASLGGTLSVTYASQPIGTAVAGRVVVVVLQSHMVGGGNVMTMTIGGVTATSVGPQGDGQDYINMFYATVPTGTLADVVITSSIWTLNSQIAVYTVTGSSGSPISTASTAWGATGPGLPGPMHVTATVPIGGFGVAGFCTDRNVLPTTWSNGTLDLGRLETGSSTDIFAVSTATSGSVTPTSEDKITSYAAVMATWGPA